MNPTFDLACMTASRSSEGIFWGGFSLASAIITALLAPNRGRSGLGWFFIGGFLPWLSIVLLYLLPDRTWVPAPSPLPAGPPGPDAAADAGRWPSTSEAGLALPQDGWFYSRRRQALGPVSIQYLRGAIETGSLSKSVPVWCPAFRDWVTPDRVPGFFG